MLMDEQSSVLPIRRLLSRKSKPSMADLVDHHRSTYWASPSSTSSSNHLHGSSVNGNRVSVAPNVEDILGVLSENDDDEQTLKEREEVKDNLPLAYLCKRVIPSPSPQSSSPFAVTTTAATTSELCTAPRCHRPVVQSDDRWDGQFCSVECLLQVCHDTFHAAFRDHSRLQQQQTEHYLTSTLNNSTGIFS